MTFLKVLCYGKSGHGHMDIKITIVFLISFKEDTFDILFN